MMHEERKSETEGDEQPKKPYAEPKIVKHENLKEITLLSFTPPGS